MSFFNPRRKGFNATSPSPDNPNVLMYLLAAIALPFIQSAKWLKQRAYGERWSGAFRAFLGFAFGVGAGIGAGRYVGWNLHYNWLAWLGSAVVALLVTYNYAWPAAYLGIVHPVYRFCDAVYDAVRKLTSKYFKPIATGLVTAIRSVCIGSSSAWARLLKKEDGVSWFVGLLGVVAYVATAAGAGYLGWNILHFHFVNNIIANYAIGGTLGFAAALLTLGVGFQLVKYGETPFIALLSGGAVTYGVFPYIAAKTASFGVAGVVAASVVAFVLAVGYGFPLVNAILTGGFWVRAWKRIEPRIEKTYGDSDKNYTQYFHHLVNLATTGAVIFGSIVTCSSLALPLAATAGITAGLAVIAYLGIFRLIDHSAGNALFGAATGVSLAVWLGKLAAAATTFGVIGGAVAGVLTALLYGLVVLPALYVAFKYLSTEIGLTDLGAVLDRLYTSFDKGFRRVLDEVSHAYKNCYVDKSKYNELFVQVSNIVLAGAVFHFAGALVAGPWGIALAAVLAVLSYTLVGRALLAPYFGLQAIGVSLSVIAGLVIGTGFYAAHATHAGAGVGSVIGLAVLGGVYALGFPIAYVVARFLTSWLSFATPALRAVQSWFWARFINFWNGCVVAYNFLVRVLTPLWNGIVRAYRAIAAAYQRLLDRISGRK